MRTFLILTLLTLGGVHAQNSALSDTLKPSEILTYSTIEMEKLNDGMPEKDKTSGKFKYNEEVKKLFSDENYRNQVYQTPKTFSYAASLWRSRKYKEALYMYCFLYDENPKLVLRQLIYTRVKSNTLANGIMSAFFTYGNFDPSIVSFPNGKFQIERQDLIEPMGKKFELFSKIVRKALNEELVNEKSKSE